MILKKIDIETELINFVSSNQFANFRLILESLAATKFEEMQKTNKSYEEMLADKRMLNFYLTCADELVRKVESLERQAIAQREEQAKATEDKINRAQELL